MQRIVLITLNCCFVFSGCGQDSSDNGGNPIQRGNSLLNMTSEAPIEYLGKLSEDGAVDADGFTLVEGAVISPRVAVALAEQFTVVSWYWRHLNLTPPAGYNRNENGLSVFNYVVRQGEWYYVACDSVFYFDKQGDVYPISKSNAPEEWFLPGAVRVNMMTGKVVQPPETQNISSQNSTQ